MRLPAVHGVIERRILVNYRVAPDAIRRILPPPFEPQIIHGHAIGGICLIRLSGIRPRLVPECFGLRSENAAHRIAVQWTDGWHQHTGVYIPRRDSSSCANVLLGGRVFSGVHNAATFRVREAPGEFQVEMTSLDQTVDVGILARPAAALPADSVFSSLEEASDFFCRGSLGCSTTADPGRYDALELRCRQWSVRPLAAEWVRSSFFDDAAVFHPGEARFDCALLMENVPHEWRRHPAVRRGSSPAPRPAIRAASTSAG